MSSPLKQAHPPRQVRQLCQFNTTPSPNYPATQLETYPFTHLAPTKRGPGRPRKNPATTNAATAGGASGEETPKRKRGRPPRVSNPPISTYGHSS